MPYRMTPSVRHRAIEVHYYYYYYYYSCVSSGWYTRTLEKSCRIYTDRQINATNLSLLISIALVLSAEHGLTVHSVTMDGTATNIDAMRQLGCKIGNTSDSIDGKFSHPSTNLPVYFILDACHMLKLARNALADLKVFKDSDGRVIKWKHIDLLHQLQKSEGLKFANKLSNQHIEFERHKMNVKTAAQTLSISVADAIGFLQYVNHPGFEDAAGTITFIRVIDKLFDVMNSRNPRGQGFKRPLSLTDRARWSKVFISSINYLVGLTDENGFPLIQHRRKTFLIGFVLSSRSFQTLAIDLLTIHSFKYVLTYKMSQDHLEMLFACIRGKNGFNNNPDVVQLKSSLRRILLRNAIVGSKYGNCLTFSSDSIGSIFTLKWSRRRSPLVDEGSIGEDSQEKITDLMFRLDSTSLTFYQEQILGYIAGHCILKNLQLWCLFENAN